MRPHRGEVWWGEVPERGRRPYVILTRDSAIENLSEILVAVVTRTVRQIPTQVELDRGDGMPVQCAVNLDDLVMLPVAFLTEPICDLSVERMAEVCSALGTATSCG